MRYLVALCTFVLAVLFAISCGPLPDKVPQFVIVLHNGDIGYPDTAAISWWQGSAIVGSAIVVMPAGPSAVTLATGTVVPDGFSVAVDGAWPGPNGMAWGKPDYSGSYVFHIQYPTGMAWRGTANTWPGNLSTP